MIARRWRPQNYNEVVHQDHVLRTLKNSISAGRISHAYIFTGPRGVGKTTVARILAKSLNCVNGPTAEPCGICENCVEIKNGTAYDVYEIDGASNTSVDNIRDLREKVSYAPVKSKYKIYIIDEVHMLSIGAFNALLKTLEEPPAHVVFIFATTELHKVPETILSRCQKYQFRKIPVDDIAGHLRKILDADSVDYEPEAIYPIARAGGGSMRDAQSLLEQAIAFAGGKITAEIALNSLGVVPFSSYVKLIGSVAKMSAEGAIAEIDRICDSGVNLQLYAAGLAELVRSARLVKNSVSLSGASSFSKEEIDDIKKIAEHFSDEDLSSFFRIITAMISDLKNSDDERLNIEMCALDMIALKRRPSLAEILMKLDGSELQKKKITEVSSRPAPQASSARPAPEMKLHEAKLPPVLSAPSGPVTSASELPSYWQKFLDDCRKIKSYLYQRIMNDYSVSFFEGAVRLSAKPGAKMLDAQDTSFIKGFLERKGACASIEVVQGSVDDPPMPEEDVPVEDYGVKEKPSAAVQKIIDVFKGEIVEKMSANKLKNTD